MQHWSEHAQTFLGINVSGYPNLHLLLGPNTGLGHNSVVFMIEAQIDYILKVRVKNARAYDEFYQALISEVRIFNVTALLSMEEIKFTTALPLEQLD